MARKATELYPQWIKSETPTGGGRLPEAKSQMTTLSTQRQDGRGEPAKSILSERHIEQVWEKMGRIYGHRWKSSFGISDDGTWLKGLVGITPEMVAYGLHQCIQSGSDWPPTLPEFRRLCQAVDAAAIERIMVRHMPSEYDMGRMTCDQAERARREAKARALEEIAQMLEDEPRKFFEQRKEILALPQLTKTGAGRFKAFVPEPEPERDEYSEARRSSACALVRAIIDGAPHSVLDTAQA